MEIKFDIGAWDSDAEGYDDVANVMRWAVWQDGTVIALFRTSGDAEALLRHLTETFAKVPCECGLDDVTPKTCPAHKSATA